MGAAGNDRAIGADPLVHALIRPKKAWAEVDPKGQGHDPGREGKRASKADELPKINGIIELGHVPEYPR